jgi:hypothetical protein
MNDPRYDIPRSSRINPQPDAIRWFSVTSTWTDIYPTQSGATSSAEPTAKDQRCTAKHTVRHPTRSDQWVPIDVFEFLYDPSRGSKPSIGTLVRAHYNPINQHWEAFTPPSTQTYLEYLLDKSVVGFVATGVNQLVLNAANLTGWIGSTYRAGSESDVGIEYQSSEAAPQTNGNFKATKDGLFRLTLQGYYSLNATATPLVQNQSNVTTGPASAGTAHTHSVVQTGYDDYLLQAKPSLKINIWNKLAAGGAIALHKDAQNHFFEFQVACPPTTTERFVPITAQWNVCLHQNDQIAFKYTAAGMTNHEWTIDGDPCKMRFEYIGPIADFAAI